ncbi:MAG: homoserine O-acetyltransferase [Proteobacteria bacterium]|nr:homoserine O-acetyltransferase [Pseudomonadota bacterium]
MEQTTVTLEFGPSYRKVEVGAIAILAQDAPLKLDSGAEIAAFPLAYQTYGRLNADASNAILICHGLTGDQYVASTHPVTGKPGWWESVVGAGKIIDTDRYFVICPNVLGGCMGSYGPKAINPKTKKPYNLEFPVLTIADMVRAQKLLVEQLGVTKLFSVIGASMGGMQALVWGSLYKDHVRSVVGIATAPRHMAQNIAFHEVGRQAIMADPEWKEGNYINEKRFPAGGLAVARMTAHVTYLSQEALSRKFGRNLQDRERISYGFEADFRVESYLRRQGTNFVERFDANSYLYITRAMDYFDLAADNGGRLSDVFKGTRAEYCLMSFSSDWLFPTSETREIVHALNGVGANVSFVEIPTDKGHDAFLLDEPRFLEALAGFIRRVGKSADAN